MIEDQEQLWRETTADDLISETNVLRGGQVATDINPTLYHDIQVILSRLVAKASQLVDNVTTNLAESWMHIRAKYDGGKVINRSQSGSWEHRCMGAGIQQNIGRDWGSEVWKEMACSSPNKVFTNTAERSAKKASNKRKRKATEEVKQQRRVRKYSRTGESTEARKAYSRHDSGTLPDEVDDDISPEHLEELKKSFYRTKVLVTPEEAIEIEQETRDQADSERWIVERRKRITASLVGSIAKMRSKTKRSKKVENLLYSKFKGNAATRYGSVMENRAVLEYEAYQQQHGHPNLKVEKCGLYVSLSDPWLAGTPDGMVSDPIGDDASEHLGLVEIKNPFSLRSQTLMEATLKSAFCLERDGTTYSFRLKPRHDYYHQVQTQLYCTRRHWCDFVVRTNKELFVERIYKDQSWLDINLNKLSKFYFSSLLPELACPRHHKGGIREPSES